MIMMTTTITASPTTSRQQRANSRSRRVSLDSEMELVVNNEKGTPLELDATQKEQVSSDSHMKLPKQSMSKTSVTTLKRWFSPRRKVSGSNAANEVKSLNSINGQNYGKDNENDEGDDDDDDDDEEEEKEELVADADNAEEDEIYILDGVKYACYQDMVNAKRQRNQDILEQSGLLSAVRQSKASYASSSTKNRQAQHQQRGIQAKRSNSDKSSNSTSDDTDNNKRRRKSSRLQGVKADGYYIDDERAGRVTLAGGSGAEIMNSSSRNNIQDEGTDRNEQYYRGRINDGSSLSIVQAVENVGSKWMTASTDATNFAQNTLSKYSFSNDDDHANSKKMKSSDSKNDSYNVVAKLCPDRIYSVAVHPSVQHTIVCAGDKSGHIGIWNQRDDDDDDNAFGTDGNIVNDNDKNNTKETNNNSGVHLLKPHSSVVCCMEWTGSGNGSPSTSANLMSASYDGTIRLFDVHKEQFIEIFATYNSNSKYQSYAGYGIEPEIYNNRFWTQHICCDTRYNDCYFLSTSIGTVMHLDLRVPKNINQQKHITFHEPISEKKVNTISLHPNGYSMISAGLDNIVASWDIRKFGNSLQQSNHKQQQPIVSYNCGRSVNSAYFSPSGKYVVSTTMANKLDIFENIHLHSDSPSKVSKSIKNDIVQPKFSIKHDNMTGRWLTTFQAIFHPQQRDNEVFVVGSMRQPRCVEIFHPTNLEQHKLHPTKIIQDDDAITSVLSRFAFHPRTDQMIVCGGNSSGRVTICKNGI